ncbi:MAG: hypothetical protein V4640_10595 [Verrucomicrobiota bacterium]
MTLSLMILLTVIAVGLLTLSSISLRSASQGSSMAEARANARLALMLALGDLQKAAGPDKAVTASSDLVAPNSTKPNLTGVWDSWDPDITSGSLDYNAPKTDISGGQSQPGFKGWLVSDPDPEATRDRNYAGNSFTGKSIEMVGDGSLGKNARPEDKALAGKIGVSRSGKITGNVAWHVSDESVKARINTYRDNRASGTLAETRALLGGHRPDVSVMSGSRGGDLGFLPKDNQNEYVDAQASTAKVVSLNQASLFNNTDTIKEFRNDVTPYSLGLLTNVREGGLKMDLSSVFEGTTTNAGGTSGLPNQFEDQQLYETSVFANGSSVTGVSDPYWSALAGYYNVYKDLLTPESTPTLNKAPTENVLTTATVQPKNFSPAPVIAKVELLFSLVAREQHHQWTSLPGDYLAHLLYTPIFTLHNPYNVSLRFDRMKIGILNPPVAFTFYVNGQPKNSNTSLADMFNGASVKGKKEFWIDLANWTSPTAGAPNGPITMKPGQTMVFGPYIQQEPFNIRDYHASYFDYENNGKTGTEGSPLKAKPNFSETWTGFDVDWLTGGAVLPLAAADRVGVGFKAGVIAGAGGVFAVKAKITTNGTEKHYGGLNFKYTAQTILDRILPGTIRSPERAALDWPVQQLIGTAARPANSQNPSAIRPKAFALFSAYARTTNGGVDITGSRSTAGNPAIAKPDGRLAGNPYLNHNPARTLIYSDLTREKPGMQSHELNLTALGGTTDDAFSIATDGRTNIMKNYRQLAGVSIKSGTFLEIPSGPLRAISDFRRSNALASPFLPAFTQPVGNSRCSPMIATDKVRQSGVATYELLDHSFLANHALYDRAYFSTFAPTSANSAVAGFDLFMKEGKPLASQVFEPRLPPGETADEARGKLFDGSGKPTASAYRIAAEYQMVKGPFNVNSTRKEAWKAMLSSMSNSEVATLWTKSGMLERNVAAAVPIPAMTLHNGSATNGSFSVTNIDDQAANEWSGYRTFSDGEIDTLATEIVKQVRLRGPFLSMSEFVNRRLGGNSELTQMGALENAIEESGLNNAMFASQTPVSATDVSNGNLYGFQTPDAAAGNPAAGAPGWLSQADLLKVLEPAATVRSDTFVIRACGEATDRAGNVIARAYAEAVVQRLPEYVNPADPASAIVPNPNAPAPPVDAVTPLLVESENLTFGRRFSIVSFRWLSSNEI